MEQVATPIVDTPEDLTAEWFTAALREGGTLSAEASVIAARSDLIGGGQVGIVVRSELSYDDAAGLDVPASVVVKLPSETQESRQVAMAMGLYENEMRFYKEIAPLADVAVPHLHWGEVEPDTGRVTLILDDLTSHGEVGDTIAGSTPEQAELAFAELIKLQAPLWDDPRLRSRQWLFDAPRTQMLFGAVAAAAEGFKAAYEDRLDAEHVALVERLAPNASAWPAKALVDPLVLNHGDFRLDNMIFGTAPGVPAVSILDWQTCRLGPPLVDHSIFLGSCLSTEDRRAFERDLLRGYHDGLLANGVTGFSFDDCLESYRRSSLYPFLLTVALSVSLGRTERYREICARLLRGAAELVLDHGAADFLD
jgi:aminoglycoside/choline kinase family phosphotransferase